MLRALNPIIIALESLDRKTVSFVVYRRVLFQFNFVNFIKLKELKVLLQQYQIQRLKKNITKCIMFQIRRSAIRSLVMFCQHFYSSKFFYLLVSYIISVNGSFWLSDRCPFYATHFFLFHLLADFGDRNT